MADPRLQAAYNSQCCAVAAIVSLAHVLGCPDVKTQDALLVRTDLFPEWKDKDVPGATANDEGTFKRLGDLVGLKFLQSTSVALGDISAAQKLKEDFQTRFESGMGAILYLHGAEAQGSWDSNHVCTLVGIVGDKARIMTASQLLASFEDISFEDFAKHTEFVWFEQESLSPTK